MKTLGVILMVIGVILYLPVAIGTDTFGNIFSTIALSNNIIYLLGAVCSLLLLITGAVISTVGFITE